MENGLGKMTTKSGKGLLGYAVDTIVCPHDDDGNLMVTKKMLGHAAWHRFLFRERNLSTYWVLLGC
jgi:hypothetical protein